jgi:hypothetical protein
VVDGSLLPQNIYEVITYSTLYYLQKFTDRINGTSLLWKIISSFILFLNINRLFIGIDSSEFKTTNASQYYTYKAKIPKKYVKLSVSADVLFQLICNYQN